MLDLSNYHVLIVLQDPKARDEIATSLQELKMRTTTTDSAEMAVPYFESFKVDLVVTDSASEIAFFKSYPNIVVDSFSGNRPILRDRVVSTLFPSKAGKNRVNKRLPLNRRLSWEFSGFTRPLGGTMVNINEGGAFVAAGGLLPLPGEIITMEFGEESEPCMAMGIVRWVRPLETGEPKGFGVEFLVKSDSFLNFIQEVED